MGCGGRGSVECELLLLLLLLSFAGMVKKKAGWIVGYVGRSTSSSSSSSRVGCGVWGMRGVWARRRFGYEKRTKNKACFAALWVWVHSRGVGNGGCRVAGVARPNGVGWELQK